MSFLTLLEKHVLFQSTVLYLNLLDTFMVESLLYGIHAVSFVIAIYLLATKHTPSKMIMCALSIMFALASADVALSFTFVHHRNGFLQSLQEVQQEDGQMYLDNLTMIKSYIFVSANLVADVLLVHRCYMVWAKNRLVIMLSSPLIIAQTVCGYVATAKIKIATIHIQRVLFLVLILVVNSLMTGVTAARILRLARHVRRAIGHSELKHYHIIVAVIVESGSLYTISVLLAFVSGLNILLHFIMARIVGIMPALMFIQVELSHRGNREVTEVSGSLHSAGGETGTADLATYPPIVDEGVSPRITEEKPAKSGFARLLPFSMP